MLIKRVIIQGFKTFANRTEFLFDPGITAVVGPNGSGKSNIVDAVRWCLGEQSFGLLRSKKTSDIIFAGSDKRARLGMAEVSLTLDNTGGEIPIDFAEVEITRRAYRDGDNEYLVNGQRVRLLDIVELLAQTGLGKRTYSVIGQGLIDKVLGLTPEERRSLFEEAAGITGYQHKRETTTKRLDAMQQNLARVHDIVAELSPRLGTLKRQAERARERERIAIDLRTLLRDWYGYRWHTTVTEVKVSQQEAHKLKEVVAQRQAALSEINRQIEAMRTQQATLRAELGELHRQSSALHKEAETTSRELAVAQERLRQIKARQEDTQRELTPLHLQTETLAARLAELQHSLAEAQAQHQERLAAVATIQGHLNQRQAERSQLQDALDSARRTQTELQNRETDVRSRLKQLLERRNTLQSDRVKQQQKIAQATQELDHANHALQEAEQHASQDERRVTAMQEATRQAEQHLQELRKQVEAAEIARRGNDRDLDRLQTRYDLLRRLQSEGMGYASGVRAVLQTNQPGVLGTVAALLRVPAQLDKAIETALGGALQNIITSHWEAAQQAIESLKRSGRGRATFLPLDRLHNLSTIQAPKQPGILGNAASLVDYDAAVAPAIEQLLNRVWIAESLPLARQALDRWRENQRPTVVTLDGEIIRPGGAVSGGSENERRDESILSRERDLRTLPGQISAATQAAQKAVAACSDLNKQIAEQQSQIQKDQQTLADLARADRQQRQRLEDLRRQVDRSQQSVRWEGERLGQIEGELNGLGEREQELHGRQTTLSNELTQASSAVAQAQAEAERAGVDTLLRQLADARTAAAEAQGYLRSQQTLQENQQRLAQSTADQIRAKQERLATLGHEESELATRISQMSQQETTLGQAIATLRQQIEPAERQLAQLEQAQNGQESNERASQQALRKEESAYNAAQLHLQRSEDALYQLRNEIEQDLGLVTIEESAAVDYQPPLPWEAFVEQLPVLISVADTLEAEVRELRIRLSRVSNVNPDAPREYEEAATRYEFLRTQSEDLEAAAADLRKIIKELDEMMKIELQKTFDKVATEFVHFFQMLFNGGTAQLELTNPGDIMNSGVEIIARPPGKRPQSLALLSGGEKALAASALIFAILRVSPTPFCVLDEVDAALDEANVDRLRQTVGELSGETQFIIVTHNRRTLEGSNTIYGVTMGNDGVSRVISLRLEGDKIMHRNGNGNGAEMTEKKQIAEIEELVKM